MNDSLVKLTDEDKENHTNIRLEAEIKCDIPHFTLVIAIYDP